MFTGVELTSKFQLKCICSELHLSQEIDNNSALTETCKILNNLGIIEVRLYHVALNKVVPVGDRSHNLVLRPVREKSKKLGCHHMLYVLLSDYFSGVFFMTMFQSLGRPIECEQVNFYQIDDIDDGKNTFARFIFRHRLLGNSSHTLDLHGIDIDMQISFGHKRLLPRFQVSTLSESNSLNQSTT